MKALGIECRQMENGIQKLSDGTELKLPPILFGTFGKDALKKTLLIYGHLDVQPADISDGWDTEPFKMIEKDGKFFGRGTSDDKGPVIGWLNAIETMQKLNIEIPVNLKVRSDNFYCIAFIFSLSLKEWKKVALKVFFFFVF